jgi:hypothetical protein
MLTTPAAAATTTTTTNNNNNNNNNTWGSKMLPLYDTSQAISIQLGSFQLSRNTPRH